MSEEIKPIFEEQKSTTKKESRTFVIVNPDGTESGGYKGKIPSQAAKKAIKEICKNLNEPVTLRIRERGTKKIHIFRGHVSLDQAPEKRPAWMPAMVKMAHVTKVGVEKVV